MSGPEVQTALHELTAKALNSGACPLCVALDLLMMVGSILNQGGFTQEELARHKPAPMGAGGRLH
jgi:hypothetical protein